MIVKGRKISPYKLNLKDDPKTSNMGLQFDLEINS